MHPQPPATIANLIMPFSRFINSAISLVAIVCIVMIVFGGLKYLTAGGDKEGAASANHTITYGIVGLVVTISSWIILSLIGSFLGVDFTNFSVVL